MQKQQPSCLHEQLNCQKGTIQIFKKKSSTEHECRQGELHQTGKSNVMTLYLQRQKLEHRWV